MSKANLPDIKPGVKWAIKKKKKVSRAVLLHPITWMRKYYWAPVDNYTQPLNWQKLPLFFQIPLSEDNHAVSDVNHAACWQHGSVPVATLLFGKGSSHPKTVFAPTDKASFSFISWWISAIKECSAAGALRVNVESFLLPPDWSFSPQSQEDTCITGREQNPSFKCLHAVVHSTGGNTKNLNVLLVFCIFFKTCRGVINSHETPFW